MYNSCMVATHAGLCDEGGPVTLHGHIDDVAAGVPWLYKSKLGLDILFVLIRGYTKLIYSCPLLNILRSGNIPFGNIPLTRIN